jgi:two-component system, chemotaxis family, response regulator WspF
MRIAIANDLPMATEVLRRVVQSEPRYSIAWTAVDGREAVRKAVADPPDLILMDLVMPVLDGAEATRQIMAARPCAILVVTATVTGNFELVYAAMGHGAIDAVNTPIIGSNRELADHLPLLKKIARVEQMIDRARSLSGSTNDLANIAQRLAVARPPAAQPQKSTSRPTLIAIGASTGGPDAILRVLERLPHLLTVPILLCQHIASEYARGMAEWLTDRTGHRVRLAVSGDRPQAGDILLADGDYHLILSDTGTLQYSASPTDCPYRPSVDVLFESLAKRHRGTGIAVLLTGMGRDGARGMLTLREAGWLTIAQDSSTSVVYGMPGAAAELKAARHILPLERIGPMIQASL